MWQDVRLAVDHEFASEFASTILDAPGAQATKPSQPQAQRKAGKKGATTQGWLLSFPRLKSRPSDFIRTDVFRASMGQEELRMNVYPHRPP